MPRISVLYVTHRPGGFDILKHDLRRQRFQDFELVVVDDWDQEREAAVREYLDEFDLTYLEPRPPRQTDYWNLNKAYNDGIEACDGDLIVSLQDYIWIDENALERFWDVYEQTGDFVTGVGGKYGQPAEIADPNDPISVFETEYMDPPTEQVEPDPRIDGQQGVVETEFWRWEADWGAFPRDGAYALGGFDEEMDRIFSGDNVGFAYRASKLGYRFYTDKRNEFRGFDHGQWFPRPEDRLDHHFKDTDWLQRYEREFVFDYL